jgi:hypothetical protein
MDATADKPNATIGKAIYFKGNEKGASQETCRALVWGMAKRRKRAKARMRLPQYTEGLLWVGGGAVAEACFFAGAGLELISGV